MTKPSTIKPSAPKRSMNKAMTKTKLHPRNPHNASYDLERLAEHVPELKTFFKTSPKGGLTLDFSTPEAVKALNKALLADVYHVDYWDIPEGSLCPAVPGRADYIHYIADLLAADNQGQVPEGGSVRGLDIGMGANCIYPILGAGAYAWSFVGSDISEVSVKVAEQIVKFNAPLKKKIRCRLQASSDNIFNGVIKPKEYFYFTLCNPPFHASAKEAAAATQRKVQNLGTGNAESKRPVQNFSGEGAELWCQGGELGFVSKMVNESADFAEQCLWFTCLVSKSSNIAPLKKLLAKRGADTVKVVEMAQGNKVSRFIAWSFYAEEERGEWF